MNKIMRVKDNVFDMKDVFQQSEPEINIDELQLLTIKDIISMDIPDNNWLYFPILKRQGITMLSGDSGVRKSFFSLFLSLSLANVHFNRFEVEGWEARTDSNVKVLYVDGEMANNTIKERITDCCSGEIDNTYLQYITLESLNDFLEQQQSAEVFGFDIRLENELFQNVIIDLCVKYDFEFIVFDNLSSLTSIDITSQQEYSTINKFLLKLRNLNISVLLVHHNNKSNSFIGSNSIVYNIDTHLSLSKDKSGKNTINFLKCRDNVGPHSNTKTLKFDDDRKVFYSTTEKMKQKSSDRQQVDEDIKNYLLEDNALSQKEICKLIIDEHGKVTGANESNISRIKKSLTTEGLLK